MRALWPAPPATSSCRWRTLTGMPDEELDMLDLAFGLTETSLLGCQVCVSKELSGITVRVPEGVNDQLG